MPCRDYSDDVRVVDNTQTYKELRDKLARIACMALTKLETMGVPASDLSQEADVWFTKHKIDDAKAEKLRKKREAEEAERKRVEREAKRTQEIATLKKLQAKYRGVV